MNKKTKSGASLNSESSLTSVQSVTLKSSKKGANLSKMDGDKKPRTLARGASYTIARKSILVFSALGIMISIYMFYAKLNTSALVCGISPCYVVNESQYSYLFGIPLSAYGVAFYLLIFILALLMKKYLLFWISLFGVLFSVYLTYLEFFVIHAWCQWCVTSALLTLFIFIGASILFFKFRTR